LSVKRTGDRKSRIMLHLKFRNQNSGGTGSCEQLRLRTEHFETPEEQKRKEKKNRGRGVVRIEKHLRQGPAAG
jgi:hypothetical protein